MKFANVILALQIFTAPSLETLQARLDTAEQHYDAEAAQAVADDARTAFQASHGEENLRLLVHALLAVADLQRLAHEFLPEDAYAARRDIGKKIDAAAEEGLKLLDALPESSESQRMRADFYGTMIRSDYRATRYHKRMDAAIARALELDPVNPLAQVSAARPLLFADPNHGQDLEGALEHLDKALRLDPGLEAAQALKALVLEKQDQVEDAIALYKQLLQNNPNCLPAKRRLEALVPSSH